MKISISAAPSKKQFNEMWVIIGVFEKGKLTPQGRELDQKTGKRISTVIAKNKFQGKVGNILPILNTEKKDHPQILLVGCGDGSKLTATSFRKILNSTMRCLSGYNIEQAICYLTELEIGKTLPWQITQITLAAQDSVYCFDKYKTKKNTSPRLNNLVIFIPNQKEAKACQLALDQGLAIADAMRFAKDLGNTPSNICTPSYLADQARHVAKESPKLKLKILEQKEMQKLGMGALLGVAQGSKQPPKLICLEYNGGNKKQAPIVFVGKGVTFDTGGISLKPSDSMVGMKYDMCGAATVLAVLKAAAALKLPLNIVGVAAAVENMPDGGAYKPEDILTSMSGQTIEIISTDAEGRLILADALTYCERYKPEVVIDIATLTGAVIVALGFEASAIVSNDEGLTQDLLHAGIESNDRAWQLPMWEEYQEAIKSPFADMVNAGSRYAGTITAGCFLSRFSDKYRWAHMDVAGTAAMMMGVSERRATGRPVPLLMQYLLTRAEQNGT